MYEYVVLLKFMECYSVGGWVSPSELTQKLNCHRSTTRRYLNKMVSSGIVIKPKRGVYMLNSTPQMLEASKKLLFRSGYVVMK